MNKVILIGNVGSDSELKTTQSGQSILKFSLATSEKWKDKEGNKQEKTEWHRCQLWGTRGNALHKYILKGTKLAVEGSIAYSSYGDKDGNTRYVTDIKVYNLEFVGGQKTQQRQSAAESTDYDEPMPF